MNVLYIYIQDGLVMGFLSFTKNFETALTHGSSRLGGLLLAPNKSRKTTTRAAPFNMTKERFNP